MGTSKRNTDLRSMGIPGPGSYNFSLVDKKNNPSWRVGTATRRDERKSEVPGPGTYNSPGKLSTSAPKHGFGARTAVDFKHFTPGPGAYTANGSRGFDIKAPSYSFRVKAAPEVDKTQVPGPGAYDQSSRIQSRKGPAFRIGSSKREDMVRSGSTPGPGQYVTRPSTAYAEGPRYGFGSSERDSSTGMRMTAPGPGAYAPKGSFDQGSRGFSLVPRRPDSAVLGVTRSPGPGAYNPSSSVRAAPAYRIGSAVRDTRERATTPGPGNYNPSAVHGKQNIRIGTSTRKGMYEEKNTPGPGAYTHNPKVGEGPKYIMNPRRDDGLVSVEGKLIPGPGAYNPSVNLTKHNNSSVGIGSGNRTEINPTKANPGPGQYDTRGRIGGPKYGFGTGVRKEESRSVAPGPGQYTLPHTVGDVPKYALGTAALKIHL